MTPREQTNKKANKQTNKQTKPNKQTKQQTKRENKQTNISKNTTIMPKIETHDQYPPPSFSKSHQFTAHQTSSTLRMEFGVGHFYWFLKGSKAPSGFPLVLAEKISRPFGTPLTCLSLKPSLAPKISPNIKAHIHSLNVSMVNADRCSRIASPSARQKPTKQSDWQMTLWLRTLWGPFCQLPAFWKSSSTTFVLMVFLQKLKAVEYPSAFNLWRWLPERQGCIGFSNRPGTKPANRSRCCWLLVGRYVGHGDANGTNWVQPRVASSHFLACVACLACFAAAKLGTMLGQEGLSAQTEIFHLGLH